MFAKTISAVALFTALGVAGATAQSRSGPIIPAEMPPSGYTGTQYVDSRGCVFIRAGFDGRVTWVPRYGDDRRPMCGFEPSLASATAPSRPAPTQPVAAPVAPTATYAAAAPQQPAPTTPPRASGAALAATGGIPWSVPPEPARPPRTAGAGGAATVHTVSGPHGLDTRWSFYDRTGPGPCAHLSPHSQLYMVPSPAMPELPLRCGPQAQHPADAVNELAPRGGVWEPWDGVNPSPMAPNVYQRPPAYSPSWPDAHLRGQPAPAQHAAAAPARRQVTVSSMGSAAPQTVAPAGRYVQVGTFGVEANARATVSRLQAQGLPVATGRAQRGGQALQTVMVGPFGTEAEIGAALGTARALGFRDAFVR